MRGHADRETSAWMALRLPGSLRRRSGGYRGRESRWCRPQVPEAIHADSPRIDSEILPLNSVDTGGAAGLGFWLSSQRCDSRILERRKVSPSAITTDGRIRSARPSCRRVGQRQAQQQDDHRAQIPQHLRHSRMLAAVGVRGLLGDQRPAGRYVRADRQADNQKPATIIHGAAAKTSSSMPTA